MTFIAGLMAVPACLALLQCLAGVWAVIRFAAARGRGALPADPPPVTVLKPLCGDEPLLEEALTSCFAQDYPAFQIVFGIQNPNDPALGVLERVRQRFPDRDIAVVVD